MKTKKFGTKLELNKTTITNLEETIMKNALAGNAPDTGGGGSEPMCATEDWACGALSFGSGCTRVTC